MKPFFFCSLFLLLLCSACNQDDDDSPAPETRSTCDDGIQNGEETRVDCGGTCPACIIAPPSSGNYVYGVIDGKSFLVSGDNGQSTSVTTCDDDGRMLHENGGIWQRIDIDTGDIETIALVTLTQNRLGRATPEWLYDMYGQANYTYEAPVDCDLAQIQASISWLDEDGIFWSTNGGDQTGSTFEITDRGALEGYFIPVQGRFSAKFYSTAGDVLEVESGVFSFLLVLF